MIARAATIGTIARCCRLGRARSRLLNAAVGGRRREIATLLTHEERASALESLRSTTPSPHQWNEAPDRNAIQKTFTFSDFNQAWRFMSGVALVSEKMDHHPEFFNLYNTVEVTLTTHECGGVSAKDVKLAQFMDECASEILPGNKS